LSDPLARVLIVAGSDSGGGAGIQADIKAVMALGGYAATAITALTAQNTQGVFGVVDVPASFVAQQMALVLDDIGADAIKTGMMNKGDVIAEIAAVLADKAPKTPLVVDPVMVAKGGHKLLDDKALGALRARLLPRAALLTPNIPEAELLTGFTIEDPEAMLQAGRDLLALGPRAVLVKGGHLPGDDLVDVLVTAHEVHSFPGRRIHTQHTHGTGCTLASAIAEGLGRGLALPTAIERARAYVRQAIATAPGLGKGHGPLNHGHTVKPFLR
jgi:hydroxymethylpyrimidine/phosphomethylpyrimidine kinase